MRMLVAVRADPSLVDFMPRNVVVRQGALDYIIQISHLSVDDRP